MARPINDLEILRARYDASRDPDDRSSCRTTARRVAARLGVAAPEWAAHVRVPVAKPTPAKPAPAAPAPSLTATMREQAGPVTLPRYASARDWSSADSGNRGLIWHPGSEAVTLVSIVTDLDRRVAHFPSEQAALEAVHSGEPIDWAKPKPRSKRKGNWGSTGHRAA